MARWHWRLGSLGALVSAVGAHGSGGGHFHEILEKTELELEPHLLEGLFTSTPLVNAVVAVSLSTLVTQAVLFAMPPLSDTIQAFLVAFAAGGMLGNIFLHLVPMAAEAKSPSTFGMLMAGAFMVFVAIDKLLKQILAGYGSTGHSHSHGHNHSHSSADANQKEQKETNTEAQASQTNNLATILNVAADALHNVADGFSLAAAFQMSSTIGARAFVVMCFHEMPHQFGDFALVIRNGAPKRAGMIAQLITVVGTLAGVILGSVKSMGSLASLGSLVGIDSHAHTELSLAESVTPISAGLFLYVATVGVLPEMLEPTSVGDTIVQFLGMGTGFGLMSHLS